MYEEDDLFDFDEDEIEMLKKSHTEEDNNERLRYHADEYLRTKRPNRINL